MGKTIFYSREYLTRISAELRNVNGTVSSGGFILDELTWQKPVRLVSINRPAYHKGKPRYGGTKSTTVEVVKHQHRGEKNLRSHISRCFFVFIEYISPDINSVQYQLEEHKAEVLSSDCCLMCLIPGLQW